MSARLNCGYHWLPLNGLIQACCCSAVELKNLFCFFISSTLSSALTFNRFSTAATQMRKEEEEAEETGSGDVITKEPRYIDMRQDRVTTEL